MKKDELQNRIKDGLFEAAPDIWDEVLCRVQQEVKDEAVVPMKKCRRKKKRKILASCATIAAACLVLLFYFRSNRENIYVVLSVNPQVEIVLDDSYEVKRVKALNDDGKQILQGVSGKKGMPIDELMDELIGEMQKGKYLHDGSGMLFAVCASQPEKSKVLIQQMDTMVEQEIKEHDLQDVVTAFLETEKKTVRHAKEILGETIGESGQNEEMELSELLKKCSEQGVCDVKVANESPKEDVAEVISQETVQQNVDEVKKATLSKEHRDKVRMPVQKQEDTEAKPKEKDEVQKTEPEAMGPQPPVNPQPQPQTPTNEPPESTDSQPPSQPSTPPSDDEGDSGKGNNGNNGNNDNGNNGNHGNGNNGNAKGNNGNGNGNNGNNGYENSGNSNAGSKANSSDKKEKKKK